MTWNNNNNRKPVIQRIGDVRIAIELPVPMQPVSFHHQRNIIITTTAQLRQPFNLPFNISYKNNNNNSGSNATIMNRIESVLYVSLRANRCAHTAPQHNKRSERRKTEKENDPKTTATTPGNDEQTNQVKKNAATAEKTKNKKQFKTHWNCKHVRMIHAHDAPHIYELRVYKREQVKEPTWENNWNWFFKSYHHHHHNHSHRTQQFTFGRPLAPATNGPQRTISCCTVHTFDTTGDTTNRNELTAKTKPKMKKK